MEEMTKDMDVETVVSRYMDMVYRLAFARTGSRSDADDICQEVFLRYFQAGKKFESQEHLKAWLIRVTVNCTKKLQTSVWFRRTQGLEEDIVFEQPESLGLWEELQKLKPNYRTVIHLYYYEGYSVEEIAGLMKQKKSTVRTWLTRARYRLRELLEQ